MTPIDHLRAATARCTKYSGDDGVVMYIMLAPKGPLIVASKGACRADRYVPWDAIGPDMAGLVDDVRRELMLQLRKN